MTPEEAYWFVIDNPDCDIGKYQEITCKDHWRAYCFARGILEANIFYCQKHVCKNHRYAYEFALCISEADIEYLYEYSFPSKYLGRKMIGDFILKDL